MKFTMKVDELKASTGYGKDEMGMTVLAMRNRAEQKIVLKQVNEDEVPAIHALWQAIPDFKYGTIVNVTLEVVEDEATAEPPSEDYAGTPTSEL